MSQSVLDLFSNRIHKNNNEIASIYREVDGREWSNAFHLFDEEK